MVLIIRAHGRDDAGHGRPQGNAADPSNGQNGPATLPIVAMTANAFAEDMQKSLDAGMDTHITKPLDLDKLLRTIAQYRR